MLRLDGAAKFEHVQHADKIGTAVGFRLLQAVAHPRLRGQVDNDVRRGLFARRPQRGRIFKHGFDSLEFRHLRQKRMAAPFQFDIVVGCHSVETDHGMAVAQQAPRNMKADESGGSGDKKAHHETPFGAIR